MNLKYSALYVLVLISCISCQGITQSESTHGKVHHIVVCWLKEPDNAEARQRVIDASYSLSGIPGVIDVRAGTVLPDPRPTVDSSFDVALVITFESESALREYVKHPLHQNAVETTIKPLVARYIAYDFIDGR